MTQHYLGYHMFAHINNIMLFRIVCPALNNKHTATSNWHLDSATLTNSTTLNYSTIAALKCDEGYWLQNGSTEGQPNVDQNVKCGSNGEWTPPAGDCSIISMNLCENCLTSFPVVS
jgi:hypothetical protein